MIHFIATTESHTSSDCASPNLLLPVVDNRSRLTGIEGRVRFRARSGKVTGGNDEGTIMVDALVAVVIISLMIAMCMSAINIASQAWRNSRQMRQAEATLAYLIDSTPRRPGQYAGTRDGFRYKVAVEEQKTLISRDCRMHAVITSGRSYSLDAARWCDRIGTAG